MADPQSSEYGKPEFSNDTWSQRESDANVDTQPVYPYNTIHETESGHVFEMDDTPGRERVRLQHRGQDDGTPGTFIEMHANGDQTIKVYGSSYEITIKDKNIQIGGVCNITITGDTNLHVEGNMTTRVDGDYELHVRGNMSQVVEGVTSIQSCSDMNVGVSAGALGALTISTGDALNLQGDLNVDGEISANKIHSHTRVDAGTGISAGPLGFVSVTGGLSIGIPVAVPTVIMCSNLITSPTMVATSLLYGNLILDPRGGMPEVRGIFNAHWHPKTGSSIPKM